MNELSDCNGQLGGMRSNRRLVIALALLLGGLVSPGRAAVTVYDNLSTAATAGYSEAAANSPVFGDTLTLSDGGTIATIGLSLFNSSSSGNTGAILAGVMAVSFFDNTVPYSGGPITGALLGSANLSMDFITGYRHSCASLEKCFQSREPDLAGNFPHV